MAISRDMVRRMARLARIELSEAEMGEFERQLSEILDFVAQLNELDTSSIEPMTGGTELVNVMREDQTREGVERLSGEGLVEAAPRKHDGFLEVPAVFERE